MEDVFKRTILMYRLHRKFVLKDRTSDLNLHLKHIPAVQHEVQQPIAYRRTR